MSYGYEELSLNASSCREVPEAVTSRPVCSEGFPWIHGAGGDTDAALAKDGVLRVGSATISGDYRPKNRGQLINQAIREKVLTFSPNRPAKNSLVAAFARACAKPLGLPGITAYQASAHSLDTGKDVVGIYAVDRSVIVWLEFDYSGWKESDYLRATRKALGLAAAR